MSVKCVSVREVCECQGMVRVSGKCETGFRAVLELCQGSVTVVSGKCESGVKEV